MSCRHKNSYSGRKSLRTVSALLGILLFAAVLASTPTVLAKFRSMSSGEDSAHVALMAAGAEIVVVENDLPQYPGSFAVIPVTVTNQQGGKTCEVTLSYRITASTQFGALPLTFTYYTDPTCTNEVALAQGSFAAGVGETDTYWVKIEWQAEHNDPSYATQLETVCFEVSAEQMD